MLDQIANNNSNRGFNLIEGEIQIANFTSELLIDQIQESTTHNNTPLALRIITNLTNYRVYFINSKSFLSK